MNTGINPAEAVINSHTIRGSLIGNSRLCYFLGAKELVPRVLPFDMRSISMVMNIAEKYHHRLCIAEKSSLKNMNIVFVSVEDYLISDASAKDFSVPALLSGAADDFSRGLHVYKLTQTYVSGHSVAKQAETSKRLSRVARNVGDEGLDELNGDSWDSAYDSLDSFSLSLDSEFDSDFSFSDSFESFSFGSESGYESEFSGSFSYGSFSVDSESGSESEVSESFSYESVSVDSESGSESEFSESFSHESFSVDSESGSESEFSESFSYESVSVDSESGSESEFSESFSHESFSVDSESGSESEFSGSDSYGSSFDSGSDYDVSGSFSGSDSGSTSGVDDGDDFAVTDEPEDLGSGGSGDVETVDDVIIISPGDTLDLVNTNTGETSTNTVPVDDTYKSESAAGAGVQTDPEPLPQEVTVAVGGRNIEDIQVNAKEDEQTISSNELSVGCTLPEVGSGGSSRMRRSTGALSNLIFYRQFNSSDASTLNDIVGDGVFDAFWGFVATFYKVGSVPSATNTFQIVLACDDNYDNTGSPRCVLSFVFVQMDNIQTSDGQFMIIGAFDNSTGKL